MLLRCIFATVLATPLAGCNSDSRVNERVLEVAANAFSDASGECLLDVLDRGIWYEVSSNCASLSTLATQVIEAGGDLESAPCKYKLIVENAKSVAWSARASSALGGGMQTLFPNQ
jgi:hypothetical protein